MFESLAPRCARSHRRRLESDVRRFLQSRFVFVPERQGRRGGDAWDIGGSVDGQRVSMMGLGQLPSDFNIVLKALNHFVRPAPIAVSMRIASCARPNSENVGIGSAHRRGGAQLQQSAACHQERRVNGAAPAADRGCEVNHYLEMAKRNTLRAAGTAARLLAFSRQQPLDPKASTSSYRRCPN
jgi:hypothetical protein